MLITAPACANRFLYNTLRYLKFREGFIKKNIKIKYTFTMKYTKIHAQLVQSTLLVKQRKKISLSIIELVIDYAQI